MDMIRARESMYKLERDTIKSWMNEVGCRETVGYWYDYGNRNLVLYTNSPGRLIGKGGKNIEVLRNKLKEQMVGNWTVELSEIKGGFVVA